MSYQDRLISHEILITRHVVGLASRRPPLDRANVTQPTLPNGKQWVHYTC
jgi:hypothetical protein